MTKPMFPELEKTSIKDLIGLKIVKVISSLHDTIQVVQCQDELGEIHEIRFHRIDTSCIAVELDGIEIANLEMEV